MIPTGTGSGPDLTAADDCRDQQIWLDAVNSAIRSGESGSPTNSADAALRGFRKRWPRADDHPGECRVDPSAHSALYTDVANLVRLRSAYSLLHSTVMLKDESAADRAGIMRALSGLIEQLEARVDEPTIREESLL